MSYYQVLAHQPVSPAPAPEPKAHGRQRARHPAGSEKGGEFVADDPATPEDEAFTDEN